MSKVTCAVSAVNQRDFVGHRVVLVSSGAIGVGCQKMGLAERPANLAQRQAVAAVGQIHLMRYYQDFFAALGLVICIDRQTTLLGTACMAMSSVNA